MIAATRLDDVAVRMRDGTTLYADVHLPDDGARPVVLLRTIWSKTIEHAELDVDAYLARGFAVVIQDVRGRYMSEGSHYHGRDELEDGQDTLEWIAAQPWCDGKIGMTGLSYPAAVQTAAAASGTEALTSMFHVKAPSHYYLNGARRGGNFLGYLLPIEFLFACTAPEALADAALERSLRERFAQAPEWMTRLPFRPGQNPLTPVADVEQFFLDLQEHREYTDFWKANPLWSLEEHLETFADTAALFVGGWYDMYREDRLYSLLRDRPGPVHLLMGPWGHRDFEGTLGEVDFGPEAALSQERYTALQLDWFEQTLRGAESDRPRVTVFVMGGGSGERTADGLVEHGGRWRAASDWPLPGTRFTPYYLHESGRLVPGQSPPAGARWTQYVHDPERPVPSIGVNSLFVGHQTVGRKAIGRRAEVDDLWVPYGPYDQRERPDVFGCTSALPLWSRKDVLTFETPPLQEAVEVIGPIELRLWISSSAPDTDFIVKLVDVHPSGFAMNLGDGVLRASYREGIEQRVPLTPDEVYELHISSDLMYPTANRFERGHRIRLHVASSDFPAYDVNPGSEELPVKARNRVFHDLEHPSHILLPIVPTEEPTGP